MKPSTAGTGDRHRPPLLDPQQRPVLLAGLFVLVICMAIVGFESWRIFAARNVQIAESETSARNLAKSLAEHAAGTFTQADMLLLSVVDRLESDGTNAASIDRLHRLLQSGVAGLPQLERLSVIDANGFKITSDLPATDRTIKHADREYFRYHHDHVDRVPHLGAPVRSRTANGWIITVSRRFDHRDGSFAGVVVAAINLSYFSSYYEQFDIGRYGTIVLVMSDGTVVERRPFKQDLIGTSLAKGQLFREHIAFDDGGTATITSAIDGMERLTAFQKLGFYPAYAVVSVAKNEVLARWLDDSLFHACASLLLIVILLWIGRAIVGHIARRQADQSALEASRADLQLLNQKLDSLAREDGLTGLANRREFDRVLADELKKLDRNGTPLSLVMVDVDRFKAYNDEFGHVQGDDCLRKVAAQVRTIASRPSDLPARYGGEEFAVLLPETDADGAVRVAHRLREAVLRCGLVHPGSEHGIVTISIGVATLDRNTVAVSASDFVARADAALYRAKEDGRNRISVTTNDARRPVAMH